MTVDYLLKFQSKQVAEQFGLANGFAQLDDDGVIQTALASHTYALHQIGEHFVGGDEDTPAVGDGQYWVLFRDLVGIPVPAGGEQFIFWSSDMSFIDDAGSETQVPRPEFNPDVPSVFWA
jgi:hypothetical protein